MIYTWIILFVQNQCAHVPSGAIMVGYSLVACASSSSFGSGPP